MLITVQLDRLEPPAQVRLMDAEALLHRQRHPGAPPWRVVALSAGPIELPADAVAFL